MTSEEMVQLTQPGQRFDGMKPIAPKASSYTGQVNLWDTGTGAAPKLIASFVPRETTVAEADLLNRPTRAEIKELKQAARAAANGNGNGKPEPVVPAKVERPAVTGGEGFGTTVPGMPLPARA